MIYKPNFFLLVILHCLLSSCNNTNRLAALVENMIDEEVAIPDSIIKCKGTGFSSVEKTRKKRSKIVIYLSKEVCTECNLDKLTEWDELMTHFPKWDILFIMSTPPDGIMKIKEIIKDKLT